MDINFDHIEFSRSNSSKQRKACGECGSFEHTVLCCSSIVFNFKLLILLLQILDRLFYPLAAAAARHHHHHHPPHAAVAALEHL